MSNYKLRSCILGHENDIKSIYILPSGNEFISASRDFSTRLWIENGDTFILNKKFTFHKSYISTVYYLVNSLFPDGLIMSGGYDKIIHCYSVNSNKVEFTLTGHTNNVTSITSNSIGNVVSGSMDSTAILWDFSTRQPKAVFKGHTHGIWSVILMKNNYNTLLTGSADKSIIQWDIGNNNKVIQKFVGHTDCVRCVRELNNDQQQFLSSSNDGTIRLWSIPTGTCISVFNNCSSYLYSLTLLNNNRFVCSSEGGKLYVYCLESNKLLQTITVGAQSLWCIDHLPNNDFAVVSSDGMIRLFSENPQRQNGEELVKEVVSVNKELEYANLVPCGIEALSIPGVKNGEYLKINDEGSLFLYQWDSTKELWLKVQLLDNKVNGGGQEDFVFSIDIKEGEPELKLKYNIKQDPYTVAQKFLADNDLSPGYLDQVAQFLITNTAHVRKTEFAKSNTPADATPTAYSDPFTGSDRYVPPANRIRRFPFTNYIQLQQINVTGLHKKVCELAGDKMTQKVSKCYENLQNLTSEQSEDLLYWILEVIQTWNDDQLFPLIDTLRMLVCDETCNSVCCANSDLILQLIKRCVVDSNNNRGNVLTLIKMLVNCFSHRPGQVLLMNLTQQMVATLMDINGRIVDKNVTNAVATCLLNFSILINNNEFQLKNDRLITLEVCFDIIKDISSRSELSLDAMVKLLVAIGSLMCRPDKFELRDTLTMGICERAKNMVKTCNLQNTNTWGVDVVQCATDLEDLVSTLDLSHQ